MKMKKEIVFVVALSILLVNALSFNAFAFNEVRVEEKDSKSVSNDFTGIDFYFAYPVIEDNTINVGQELYLDVWHYIDGDLQTDDPDEVSWTSSNPAIATVDGQDSGIGIVKGIFTGTTTITATARYGTDIYTNTVDITVDTDELLVSPSNIELEVGDVYTLKAVYPLDEYHNWRAEASGIGWSCDNYDVVTLNKAKWSQNGLSMDVYAMKAGEATKTCTNYKSGETAKCTVVVKGDSNGGSGGSSGNNDTNTTAVTMYRMYNPYSGEHFYTSDVTERSVLVSAGWNYEGVAWDAPTSGEPVYRLYNPYSGEHHYTMDAYERDCLAGVGWNYEGVGWYSSKEKSVPLYRLFNPNSGEHHYTKDINERNVLIGGGWNYEGIAWYGSGELSSEPEKMYGVYTESQIKYIKEQLGVPLDIDVDVTVDDPSYWEGAGTWVVFVQFTDGVHKAYASCDPETGALAKNIHGWY